MGDTYDSAAEAEVDRAQQKILLVALNAWDRALRRDECRAWTISGNTGTVHTWGDGRTWVLFVACRSVRHWTATKARLSFCHVTQDGDDEGCLRLFNLPTPDQAEVIRDVVGLRKRRDVPAEVLERLKSFAFERKPRRETSLGPNIAKGDLPLTDAHPHQTPIPDTEPAK
jgi:hypothetical protein